ncbi:DinB family protein [Deinococcus sp. QL22]|uniref:DinB family protein n=1 Tax=Deinococcus sp. QL22 TaxID=2939437 RepID=UPI002016C156|nr:DinB family protein [Deinococcus sp. QL22]UQN08640.1 DinB family protein [Deinococcus sp. QL22]
MTTTTRPSILSLEDFVSHWQGHRALTRRVIEAFPEDQLFTFTAAPPMRPFGVMATEIHMVSEMTLGGLTGSDWSEPDWTAGPRSKSELLSTWDALSGRIAAEAPTADLAFFMRLHQLPWGEMTGWVAAIYAIDNEIHHRAQAYVYLRALGTEPPAFYER